jgi:uncharacterized protein with NRDE domain
MCLIAFAVKQHPDYPLILLANRDEFFDRPTAPLQHWHDNPGIYGGRDLEAGGTWLAINARGRWAALTNFRDPQLPTGQNSRGELVVQCLTTNLPLKDWFLDMTNRAECYSGFNLVAGELNTGEIRYFSNTENQIRYLPGGCYAISNGHFNDDWPKNRSLRAQLIRHLESNHLHSDAFFELLGQSSPFPPQDLPDTGITPEIERSLSSIFIPAFSINGRDYGTRSSSVILVDRLQKVHFYERCFDNLTPSCETHSIRFYWVEP